MRPPTLPADAPPDIAGMVGQYAHGNEPSHHIAYLYVYAGAPHKTQARVRSLMDTMYAALPDGMQGNEDVGQMSALVPDERAWLLLRSIPSAASTCWVRRLSTAPAWRWAAAGCLPLTSIASTPQTPTSASSTSTARSRIRSGSRHSDIAKGGTLRLVMSSTPNEQLGVDAGAIPPSLQI